MGDWDGGWVNRGDEWTNERGGRMVKRTGGTNEYISRGANGHMNRWVQMDT